MKRISLVVVFLAVGIAVFAQQTASQGSTRPTSAQTKESAAQLLEQTKTNASNFDSVQADLNARNTSNKDAAAKDKLQKEIEDLGAKITDEQKKLSESLEKGQRLNQESLDRVDRMIVQYKAKQAELEAFVSK